MGKKKNKIISGDFYTDIKRLIGFGWKKRGVAKKKAQSFGERLFRHMRR